MSMWHPVFMVGEEIMEIYPPGALIAGCYEVVSRPMMGGMGIVYPCFDHREQRPVALKTFKPEYLPDHKTRDRFLREGSIWVNLGKHSHIVQCYGVERLGGDGTGVFLALEFVSKVQGKKDSSFRSWMVPGMPMDLEQALLFSLQIIRGMIYATNVMPSFVHRDLKPENILIGNDNLTTREVNRVRITDFGLANFLSAQYPAGELSKKSILGKIPLTEGLLGTPLYMSPEQWRGENVTIQSDMYAFGCILYEALSGQPAVKGDDIFLVEQAHLAGRISKLDHDIPKEIKDIVFQCLSIKQNERYENWSKLESEISTAYSKIFCQTVPDEEPPHLLEQSEKISAGWALNCIGDSYLDIGKPSIAVEYFKLANNIGCAESDFRLEAVTLMRLGQAYIYLSNNLQGFECCKQALEKARKLGSLPVEAAALGHMGLAHSANGELIDAADYYEKAIILSDQVHDWENMAINYGNLGGIYLKKGDIREAINYFQKELSIAHDINNRSCIAGASGNLGMSYILLGDIENAYEYSTEQLRVALEIGNRREEALAMAHLGSIAEHRNEPLRAIEYFETLLNLSREMGDKKNEGQALGNLGNAYRSIGEIRSSIDYFEASLEINRQIGDKYSEGANLGNLGGAYSSLGDIQKALDVYNQRLKLADEIGDQIGKAHVLYNIALLELNHSVNLEQAFQFANQAAELYIRIGNMDYAKDAQGVAGIIKKELNENQ
jgi:serine/threonine protein kinase